MSDNRPWTVDAVDDLSDKTTIVTGGNGGLGYEAALQLARKGAHVVIACRDLGKASVATQKITSAHPGASLEVMELDLADLKSVRTFARSFLAKHGELHVLLNNAGVMAIPYRMTADGFEMQLGTNHMGHFALTGLLMERLIGTAGARVVNVSSTAHRIGGMRFDDLNWDRGYSRWGAYAQSKLANLLFTYELQRRLEAKGADVISVGCHPGWAATDLQFVGPRLHGSSLMEYLAKAANFFLAQSAEMGALPLLYAATSPDIGGGDYIGPDGIGEAWGHPKKVGSSARSRDLQAAAKLWEISVALTGVGFEAL